MAKQNAQNAGTTPEAIHPWQRGPRPCACGCGEQTKGGFFRPGHDARFYAAQNAPEREAKKAALQAERQAAREAKKAEREAQKAAVEPKTTPELKAKKTRKTKKTAAV